MKVIILFGALLFGVSSALATQLQIGPNIRALTLNGEPINTYQKVLPIGSGSQVISLRYDALFESSAEDHEFIRSTVQVIRFEAAPNEQYALTAPKLDLSQARDFAKAPRFSLTDGNNITVNHRVWSRDELLAELLAKP